MCIDEQAHLLMVHILDLIIMHQYDWTTSLGEVYTLLSN